ncbi:hypothetical protein [Agrococcus baldri]|uniref:hypothetical protein n=1 Tax=Agrococcus baldri TaxID=153730 RepID=UPI001160AFD5|nr:hypothetical protein [Agrococcus baldri]
MRSQGRWLPGDALRVVALVSVPLAGVVAGGPSAAAMLLALGGAMALRFLRVPTATDLTGQIVLLASAWFAATGTYETVPGLDFAMHLGSGAVLAVLARAAMLPAGLLPSGSDRRAAASRVLHTTTAVLLLGLLWELGEWAGHAWITPDIGVGYEDTLLDLVADVLGGLAAALARELADARRGALVARS